MIRVPSAGLTEPLCAGRSGRRCFVVTELLKGGELLEALLERGAYSEHDARTIFATVRARLQQLRRARISSVLAATDASPLGRSWEAWRTFTHAVSRTAT